MHGHDPRRVSWLRLGVSTTPAVVLLLTVISYNSLVLVYSQLSKLGERLYPGYNRLLRVEPTAPTCDVAALRARLAAAAAPKPATNAPAGDDVDALFEDGDGAPEPAVKAPAGDDVDALFADEEGGEAKGGEAKGATGPPPEVLAFQAAIAQCEARHAAFADIQVRRTDGVKSFRSVEAVVEQVRDWGIAHQRHLILLLLLVCAITASAIRGHIALRPPQRRLDHYAAEGAQLATVGLLLWSVWAHKGISEGAGVRVAHPELYTIWLVGLAIMAGIHVINLVRLPADVQPGGGLGSLLSVPLYATMGLIAGIYFLVAENHPAGLSIYLTKLTEYARLYLQVGLYVWIGMLLKQTRLAELTFDVVRPFGLPPELLAFVAVVGAALPTAYSGASGIFVIAVGAVIYQELRKAGARRQLALAATAMSGSLGVVLNPCLLVVIVASLNMQVTTEQLYGWGFKVFLLTSFLFLVASLLNRKTKMTLAPLGEAVPGMVRALKPLVPYVIITTAVLLGFGLLLEAIVDENSAAIILPAVLLILLIYDRWAAKRAAAPDLPSAEKPVGYVHALEMATTETTGHIGALLMMMGLSICLGGIVERAELMSMVPATFGSVWTTMGLLVVVLVVVGMTLDPYGAVILVSATISDVAARNGIDPVHFWMVVLVAFELGYLTPPVALNHLLTRQVVGEDEVQAAFAEGGSWWSRHERVALPVAVMGVALLIVAFVPLMFSSYGS
ncbi:MAG: TRAP transporter large permease subunit [Myxococcales bacterium]|nr:TRAP transporter large permease subunit [Myxococcales bacterium]